MRLRFDRRKAARAWDWFLVTLAPALLMYALTDAAVVAWLTSYGPWVLPVLGAVNIALNKRPKSKLPG